MEEVFDEKVNRLKQVLSINEQGTGETVVLIHGFCGSSAYWERVLPALSKECRVLAVDLRGHGKSPLPNGEFSIEDMAEDVAKVLNQEEAGKVFLFGHSLGGYVSLAFAERYPDKLKGYGLIHSTSYPDSKEAKEGRIAGIQKIENEGMEAFIGQLVPKLFADQSRSELKESIERAKEIGLQTNQQGAIQVLKAMKNRPDRTQTMENQSIPILLAAGKEDKVIPPDKTFSTSGPHIDTIVLERSGHMSMYEEPEQLAEALLAFIKKYSTDE